MSRPPLSSGHGLQIHPSSLSQPVHLSSRQPPCLALTPANTEQAAAVTRVWESSPAPELHTAPWCWEGPCEAAQGALCGSSLSGWHQLLWIWSQSHQHGLQGVVWVCNRHIPLRAVMVQRSGKAGGRTGCVCAASTPSTASCGMCNRKFCHGLLGSYVGCGHVTARGCWELPFFFLLFPEFVQLVEAQSQCSGRVETQDGGQWKTVCD